MKFSEKVWDLSFLQTDEHVELRWEKVYNELIASDIKTQKNFLVDSRKVHKALLGLYNQNNVENLGGVYRGTLGSSIEDCWVSIKYPTHSLLPRKITTVSPKVVHIQMENLKLDIDDCLRTTNPDEYFKKACLILYKFFTIHPYADGNGHIMRLMFAVMMDMGDFKRSPLWTIHKRPYGNSIGICLYLYDKEPRLLEAYLKRWFFDKEKPRGLEDDQLQGLFSDLGYTYIIDFVDFDFTKLRNDESVTGPDAEGMDKEDHTEITFGETGNGNGGLNNDSDEAEGEQDPFDTVDEVLDGIDGDGGDNNGGDNNSGDNDGGDNDGGDNDGGDNDGTNGQGSSAQIAQRIRGNHQISLADKHVSKVPDDANAKQNIEDTAKGLPAKRSSYKDGEHIGPGGTVNLSLKMMAGLEQLSQTFKISVSELAGGVHSPNSRHYAGLAMDVDQINDQPVSAQNPFVDDFVNMCRALGANEIRRPGDAGHAHHIHCGWPRN